MSSSNFDKIATVDISIASPVSSDANFGNLLILGPAPTGTPKVPRAIPKVGVYGSLEEVQEAGFITNGENPDPVGVAARVAFSQTPTPTEVYIAIQQKAEGASGAAQTILEANEAIKTYVGKKADMAGCTATFDEDARRIFIELTGPGSEMKNTGIADTITDLVAKKYEVSVDGESVTDLDSLKKLSVFTEISAMTMGGDNVEVCPSM